MRKPVTLVVAAAMVPLAGCSATPDFDPCPVDKERVIAVFGATATEPDIADLTERGTYGSVQRMQCTFSFDESGAGIDYVSFQSIETAGAEWRDEFFDTTGAIDDGSRTPMTAWGANAFLQSDSQFYIATFEANDRFWRLDALRSGVTTSLDVPVDQAVVDQSILDIVEYAIDG